MDYVHGSILVNLSADLALRLDFRGGDIQAAERTEIRFFFLAPAHQTCQDALPGSAVDVILRLEGDIITGTYISRKNIMLD